MKRFSILIATLFAMVSAVLAQSQTFEYTPNFSAIVVSNVSASAEWYQNVFALKQSNQMKDPNGGYNIIILESADFTLELLELKGSLNRKNLLAGKQDGIEIQGHFKIGFRVPDMDACLKKLASLKINVPQVWTDDKTKKRNFLITDPDGNLVQFFEK